MSIRLIAGDCRDVLPTLAADSVQCVVTSPPYYGLRDYGTALWDGGDADCQHTGVARRCDAPGRNDKQSTSKGTSSDPVSRNCIRCGAVRIDRQIGLESSPSEYLATMVAVFREVKRVLRPDGTCWVNMGDSYAAGHGGSTTEGNYIPKKGRVTDAVARERDDVDCASWSTRDRTPKRVLAHHKPKDLLLMPARLALALQSDGWWVRSDIIWHKPNPMPESCTDRPTSAHEHVFLLTKSARYFYDADAVREPHADWRDGHNTTAPQDQSGVRKWNPGRNEYNPAGRNLRNVWTIATSPFSAAHFATFPPELAERCIRAGTSERGACSACGKPWGRVTEASFVPTQLSGLKGGDKGLVGTWNGLPRGRNDATTTGWSPGCKCEADVVPCVVLDCFAGAGTTLLVADRLQRDAIGIELNTAYTEMAMERCRADAPLFADLAPAEPPEDARMADLFADLAAD